MARQQRNYAAEYAARRDRAKRLGWSSYRQERLWRARLADDNFIRELAEEVGGPVEPHREGSLMSEKANAIVNPRDRPREPADWRIRLLRASGRI